MPRTLNTTQCPHCGSTCKTVKTDQMTRTYREVTYICTNTECGFIFVGAIHPVRTLEPSKMPDPDIRIPMTRAAA